LGRSLAIKWRAMDISLIAVEIYCKPTKKCDFVVVQSWTEFINAEYPVMFDFFQECIDQNLIVNKLALNVDGVTDLWKYYSSNQAQAEIFLEKFKNMPLNFSKEKFSMKEFWNRYEFEIDISLSEVNFNIEKELFDLINTDTGEMWSTTFPLNGPLADYYNLEKQLQNYS
jgi:hypothetical protein